MGTNISSLESLLPLSSSRRSYMRSVTLCEKKNQEKLDVLEKRKENLFDLPVIEEVDEVKNALVGQSQNTFREWNQQWTDISTSSFAELEEPNL